MSTVKCDKCGALNSMNAPVKKDATGRFACPKCFVEVAPLGDPGQAAGSSAGAEALNQELSGIKGRLEAVEKFINTAANVDGKCEGIKNYIDQTIDPSLQELHDGLSGLSDDIDAVEADLAALAKLVPNAPQAPTRKKKGTSQKLATNG